jgi:4-azaleucine resistance transporter AzlC
MAAARLGAARTLPLALGVGAYGLVYGVLAGQAGMGAGAVLLMSATVFAGASQFVALDLWGAPLPVAALVLTTLVVNLRHVLMGAALQPWLAGLPPRTAYAAVFFMVDESWALTLAHLGRGRADPAFLVGSGLLLWVAWVGSTVAGRLLGAAVADPAAWGLDFAFTAAFLALAAGLWRGRQDLLPWAVAAAVALLGHALLPGKWYIVLGGLAGSLAGALNGTAPERDGAREGGHAR